MLHLTLSAQCGSDRIIHDRDVIMVRFHSQTGESFTEALADFFSDHVPNADLLSTGTHDCVPVPLRNRGEGKADADVTGEQI